MLLRVLAFGLTCCICLCVFPSSLDLTFEARHVMCRTIPLNRQSRSGFFFFA